ALVPFRPDCADGEIEQPALLLPTADTLFHSNRRHLRSCSSVSGGAMLGGGGNCARPRRGDRLAEGMRRDSMRKREAGPADIAVKAREIETGSDYVGSIATRTRLKCLLGPRLFALLEEGWPRF